MFSLLRQMVKHTSVVVLKKQLMMQQLLLKVQLTRAAAYPSIQDQMDMQYWDAVNGTTTWKDAIAKVKSDNPKR